jgi:primase-polymerase (primpol)-like protein
MTETSEATVTRFEHHKENVPAELKAGERWVCCDENKVPLVAVTSGAVYAASSTDPSTWRGYEDTLIAWRKNERSFTGIGRVITLEEDYVGVDLDKCLDPETGGALAVGGRNSRTARFLLRDLTIWHWRQNLGEGLLYRACAR